MADPDAIPPEEAPNPIFFLKGDMGHIHSLCFPTRDYINNTPFLLASTDEGFVHFWDLNTNRRTLKEKMGSSIITMHSMEDNLITQEKTGSVKLWTLRKSNYHHMRTIETYGGFCKSVLVDTGLVVPQDQSKLSVVDIANMETTRIMNPQIENVGNIMCLTPVEIRGKNYVLGAYETGDMVLWDFDTAKAISHIKLLEQTTSITYDPVTSKGVAGSSSSILQVFHINRNTLEITIKYETAMRNNGTSIIRIDDNQQFFVVGCWDNRIRFYSWKSLKILVVLKDHQEPVSDIQFSPKPVAFWNSVIMASGGQDGVINLWNVYL